MASTRLSQLLPCVEWLRDYDRNKATQDGVAAAIATLVLIPQSLAYAMLAGMPPVAGLYASILPLVAYSLFGSSNVLAVGPVAVISLMTATALHPLFAGDSAAYVAAAQLLALMSAGILLVMALLRLGFLANFLSHPVISGFISAAAVLIAIGQTQHILGVDIGSDSAPAMLWKLAQEIHHTHWPTLAVGLGSLLVLSLARSFLKGWLLRLGVPAGLAGNLGKAGPVIVMVLAIAVVSMLHLAQQGVVVVGDIPRGLPPISLPALDGPLALRLLPSALLISLVGFIESVSIGQTLAARRRQQIHPNRELLGLGGANIAAAVSGGFPVAGGFSRSVINFDAGTATPMSGIFTAAGLVVVMLLFAPLFHNLPRAVLAAVVIVAVISLVDIEAMRRTWRYSRYDAMAMIATMAGVLVIGIEAGILIGVSLSLVLFLKRTSQPHIAVVGQLPGSQHFRNIQRHDVVESPLVLSLRVDESLYFPNARYLEDSVAQLVADHPSIQHLVLMCSAVNLIDASALESLHDINERLDDAGIQLHLSEVKGPVMDQLRKSDFLSQLSGQVFISQYDALQALDPLTTKRTLEKPCRRLTP